jgi:predicted lipoprotein with Yx(FWY)xxD motif
MGSALTKVGWRKVAALAVLLWPMVLAGRAVSSSATPSAPRSSSATKAGPFAAPGILVATGSATTAPPFYEVQTGRVKGLGSILVDGQGMTLYLFVPDKRSGRSTCYERCAEGWPPLLLPTGETKVIAGRGVKASLLGTTHRKDGTTQITYNRWPLYLWVGDSEPGQATGQGLNNLGGLWYVLSANGKAVTVHP